MEERKHMKSQVGKALPARKRFAAMRSGLAGLLSVAIVFTAAGWARAQVVAVDPVLPCCPFQKEAGFESWVKVKASNGSQKVNQSYSEQILKYNPLDPDPNKVPVFFADIDYSLAASLSGRGSIYNSISSLPLRPGGPLFQANTDMGCLYTGPGSSVAGIEQFSFAGFEGTTQRGSAVAGNLDFSTQLIQGNASSHVQYDTVSRQFEGKYQGEGIGAAGIGVEISGVSGESGVSSGSQAYSGSISLQGDYTVSYSVSGGPSAGCFFGR